MPDSPIPCCALGLASTCREPRCRTPIASLDRPPRHPPLHRTGRCPIPCSMPCWPPPSPPPPNRTCSSSRSWSCATGPGSSRSPTGSARWTGSASAPVFLVWCGDMRRGQRLCAMPRHAARQQQPGHVPEYRGGLRACHEPVHGRRRARSDWAPARSAMCAAISSGCRRCWACPPASIRSPASAVGWPVFRRPVSMRLPPNDRCASGTLRRQRTWTKRDQAAYDERRRDMREPVAAGSLKNNDIYPPRERRWAWSENAARQLSVPGTVWLCRVSSGPRGSILPEDHVHHASLIDQGEPVQPESGSRQTCRQSYRGADGRRRCAVRGGRTSCIDGNARCQSIASCPTVWCFPAGASTVPTWAVRRCNAADAVHTEAACCGKTPTQSWRVASPSCGGSRTAGRNRSYP